MSWDVPGTRSPTDLGLNAGKRKPLEPNRHLLLSSYQYFFIQPRSLLSHPKEHHCMQNDSNVKWTQYAAHVCCVCQCWCISSYTSTVLVVVLSHVTAVFFFFFQLFSLSWLCLFLVWSVWAENVTDDTVWYKLTVCWPQHHPFTASGKGQVEWSPELLPAVYVCWKTFVTGHLTDKHQVCMLDITACHSMFVFFLFF